MTLRVKAITCVRTGGDSRYNWRMNESLPLLNEPVNAPEDDYSRRFAGTRRLYGERTFALFEQAHVLVAGAGGVGSWAIEALARTGIGRLTLVDMDVLALSNVNRQLPALDGQFGRNKIDVLGERALAINPRLDLRRVDDFLTWDNLPELMKEPPQLVLDCTDDLQAKISLILWCRRRRMPLVVCGAAGGKTDASQLRVSDLAHTERDPLIAKIRRQLRHDYKFPTNPREKFGVACVYSNEAMALPEGAACDSGLNCSGYGSAVAVTATMGMLAVSEGLRLMVHRMELAISRGLLPDVRSGSPDSD